MKRTRRSTRLGWLSLCVLSLCSWATAWADDAPKWLIKLAAQPAAGLTPEVPAMVLLDETVVTIDNRGRAAREHRFAVRILNRAGLGEAKGAVYYLDKKDKVGTAEAWLLRSGKEAKTESLDKWMDWSAAAQGAIYDETRAKMVSFSDDAVPGDVFGYTTRVEGPMLFGQDLCDWSGSLPTAVERYVVVVPPGWSVAALLHGPVEPVASVSPDRLTWTWELRDRPYRPDEPWADHHQTIAAQLMLNLIPSDKDKEKVPRFFRTWSEVADWEETLTAGQCDTDPALAATVRRLVGGSNNDVEKIRALCSYVQKLRYVAINQNLARGMGYRPRKASEVHAKGFGDCKDKSNLLRAMLREAGILSFTASALSSEEREVFSDWPSPFQFNHAIIAISVGEQVDLPTVVPTKTWGRLLFFDATDAETLVGDLPWYLQGSKVQVMAPGSNELVQLPDLSGEQRWLGERHVNLTLTAKGTVSGDCNISGFAQRGAQLRRTIHSMSAKELQDWATGRISTTLRGASAHDVTHQDDAVTGKFGVTFGVSETNFAQMLPGGLAVVRLDVLSRDAIPTFVESTRKTPVELRPMIQDDEVTLALPTGFKVEELPAKTALSSPYGSYENSFTAKEGSVVFHRFLKLNSEVVSVTDYPKLRQFLSSASKADRGAVVLKAIQ